MIFKYMQEGHMGHPEHTYCSQPHIRWVIPELQHFSINGPFIQFSGLLVRPTFPPKVKLSSFLFEDHFLIIMAPPVGQAPFQIHKKPTFQDDPSNHIIFFP